MAGVRVEDAQRLWRPETLYLNTASFGLPPNTAWDTLQAVLADWRAGRTSFEGWGEFTESARALVRAARGRADRLDRGRRQHLDHGRTGRLLAAGRCARDLRGAGVRAGIGMEPGDSAIVSAELADAEERLRGTRVMAAARSGLLRTSWHVYNTDDDVDELLELLS